MPSETSSKFSGIEKKPSNKAFFTKSDQNPDLFNPSGVVQEEQEGIDAEYMVIRHLIEQNLTKDPLTKIFNRRFYDETLKKQVASARRHEKYGTKVGLIMLDIDKFKEVNDSHGHPTGDSVLKGVAEILGQNLRTEDILARYGGEEFAIIAPNTGVEGLFALAEKLRKLIEEGTRNKDYPPVTISVGYAEFNSGDEELNDATKLQIAADTALYNSKADGRNRATAYTKGMTIPEKEADIKREGTLSIDDPAIEAAVDRLAQNPEKIDKNLAYVRELLPQDPHERLLVLKMLAEEARKSIEPQQIRKTGTDDQ